MTDPGKRDQYEIDELRQMTAVDIIADDREQIPYRRALNALTGSVLATILLQQILFHWKNNRRKAFFKFTEPCTHRAYVAGDSWVEELGFTIYEFNSARDKIATKLTRRAIEVKSREELIAENIVVYWTDADRKTWYDVNPILLQAKLVDLYAKQKKPGYVTRKNQDTGKRVLPVYPVQEIETVQEKPPTTIEEEIDIQQEAISKREFIKIYAPRLAEILCHSQTTATDRAAARKLAGMRFERQWLDTRLRHYADRAEFQKPGANAYWIVNRLEDDWAKRDRNSRAEQNTRAALEAARAR